MVFSKGLEKDKFLSYFKVTQISSFHVFICFLFLGFFVYFNAVFNPFVHDDVAFIQNNPSILNLDISNIFSTGVRFGQEGSTINSYYRPLLELLYRLQYRVFSLNPHAYHFFNILLHILNSFLVYQLMSRLFSVKKRAFGIAVFFLVHPIQSEAVACISGISNLLFAFFVLSSFCYYLVPRNTKNINLILSNFLFFFALLSKEQAIVLPFLIVWYELCFGEKRELGRFKKTASYFITGFSYFIFRKILVGSTIGSSLSFSYELWLRVIAIPRTLLMYLRTIILPYDLHYYRSIDILQPVLLSYVIFIFVFILGFIVIQRSSQPQKSWLLFGIGWFLITLGPMLNIIPLVNEYSLILTSEHFLYLPMIGVLIFIMALITNNRMWVLVLAGCMCMAITMHLNSFWRSEVALFERVVRYEENFGRGHILLAKAYLASGQPYKSIAANEKARDIMQGYVKKVGNQDVKNVYLGFVKGINLELGTIYNNLGVGYARDKKWAQATEYFQKSLEVNPFNISVIQNLKSAQEKK